MADILQAVFWTATYFLIILYSKKENVSAIPPLSISLNFAWETVALFSDLLNTGFTPGTGFFIHLSWFSFDVLIAYLYLKKCFPLYLPKNEKKIFSSIYPLAVISLFFIFKYVPFGMLASCFTIDIIMATEWLLYLKDICLPKNVLLLAIGVTKLLGDFFAWVQYKNELMFVNVIGIIVLIINVAFLGILLLLLQKKKQAAKGKKK